MTNGTAAADPAAAVDVADSDGDGGRGVSNGAAAAAATVDVVGSDGGAAEG